MGSLLRRTPHTVQVTKPKTKRDGDHNVGTLDYADFESQRDVKVQFQSRGGTILIAAEGKEVPFDAILYTHDTTIAADDLVDAAIAGFVIGKFLVVGTQPKSRLRGGFSHNEVPLQKETRR